MSSYTNGTPFKSSVLPLSRTRVRSSAAVVDAVAIKGALCAGMFPFRAATALSNFRTRAFERARRAWRAAWCVSPSLFGILCRVQRVECAAMFSNACSASRCHSGLGTRADECLSRRVSLYHRHRQIMSQSNYEEIRSVGKGSFGDVFLVNRKRDGRQFVMKKMHVRGGDLSRACLAFHHDSATECVIADY